MTYKSFFIAAMLLSLMPLTVGALFRTANVRGMLLMTLDEK